MCSLSLFFDDPNLVTKIFKHDFLRLFHSLKRQAEELKIFLPWVLNDCGRYARFLEFEITDAPSFVEFVNLHLPRVEEHKERFLLLCVTLAEHLEKWQEKDSEFKPIIEILRSE